MSDLLNDLVDDLKAPERYWPALVQAALHRNRSEPTSRYLQLATVDQANQPHNRTVVFRSFWAKTEILQFAVDSRSE